MRRTIELQQQQQGRCNIKQQAAAAVENGQGDRVTSSLDVDSHIIAI